MDLKEELLDLLERDREFRYAVAGLIGLDEILKRLDKHEEELVKLREDMNRLREDMNRLREDMIMGFKRHDEILERHSLEIAKLREDMNKLREEMYAGFKRHDEELAKLREDMKEGFELLRRHIDALGARWGLMAEDAFKEGLKGILEKELRLMVERWSCFDEEGIVFGYPSQVEVDIAVHNERVFLIEVKSSVSASDVYAFKRKAELYEKKTRKKPSRLLIVTPYADERAAEAAKNLSVEIYTKI